MKTEPEVFAELIGPQMRFDTHLYFATGAESYRPYVVRPLYRLRYESAKHGVRYEMLATFNARIINRETSPKVAKSPLLRAMAATVANSFSGVPWIA